MDRKNDSIQSKQVHEILHGEDEVALIYSYDKNCGNDAIDVVADTAEKDGNIHVTVAHSLNGIFNGLNKGLTVIVNDMDSLFNPKMVHNIIGQFMNHNANKSGAKLIFSVNDETSLQDTSLSFNQIWIAMKDHNGHLYLTHQFRFLIVCEGGKTEPNYFRALLKAHRSSAFIDLSVYGLGMSTSSLVKGARQLKDKLEAEDGLSFDRVWVVFDEDGNPGFNDAISLCRHYGFEAAWTNEAFELWYYLHFEFLDAGISRHAYIKKLNAILQKKTGNARYHYKKNDKNFYFLLMQYGDEQFAMKSAATLRKRYGCTDYSKYKPCTTVDRLVNELEHPECLITS